MWWPKYVLTVKPDLSELREVLALFLKDFKTMADELDQEIQTTADDVTALVAAIPTAIQKAVDDALTNAGVDTTAKVAALAAVDTAVKAELANLSPPPAPAPAP